MIFGTDSITVTRVLLGYFLQARTLRSDKWKNVYFMIFAVFGEKIYMYIVYLGK